MNKKELVQTIAKEADVTIDNADKCLDSLTKAITQSLAKNDNVTLIGFGTFKVSKRAARTGRNPQTGAELKIPARNAPSFKAGAALKAAVN